LHPSEPQKVIGIGGSYKDSWKEGQTPYNTIRWFSKTPTSAASPGETVELPASLDTLMAETELVAVIGKRVKNASPAEAKEAIFGYTIGNDLVGDATSYHRINGESDDQPEPLFPSALKMGDRFSPYGPFIYTGIDWRNRKRTLRITNEKTGKEIVYEHNTSNMMVPPEKIVSDLSRVFSLNPGDVIFTGTTAAFPAQAGDVMEVSVEGLGTITNQVVATPKP
jgi:2-keto-4-pentenoate hydratase/2-oxohepta-3-ene-1,7-dioic acid hydratase in catechol pathway